MFKGLELVQTGWKVGAEKALGACGEVCTGHVHVWVGQLGPGD